MVTIYRFAPTLVQRFWIGELIVLARIGRVLRQDIVLPEGPPRVETVFGAKIEQRLKGRLRGRMIKVRVVGGELKMVRTPWSVRLKPGQRVLLTLSRGPKRKGGAAFVPVFGGAYPVDDRDRIRVDKRSAKALREHKVSVRNGRVAVRDLTELAKRLVRKAVKGIGKGRK